MMYILRRNTLAQLSEELKKRCYPAVYFSVNGQVTTRRLPLQHDYQNPHATFSCAVSCSLAEKQNDFNERLQFLKCQFLAAFYE